MSLTAFLIQRIRPFHKFRMDDNCGEHNEPYRVLGGTILCLTLFFTAAGPSGCNTNDLAALTAGLGTGNSVKIQSYFPTTNPVNLSYTGTSQTFMVSASSPIAGALITYTWTFGSAQVASNNLGSYVLNPSSHTPGSQNLTVVASDGITSDSRSWVVRINRSPTISTPSPSTTKGLSVGSTLALSAVVSDADGDAVTTSWTIGGITSSYLVDGGVTAGTASATLTGYSGHVGQNTVTLSVSDGLSTATQSFTININYFNSACNNLSQGQICTYVGASTLGSGSTPTSSNLSISQITNFDFDASGNVYLYNGYGYYQYGHIMFWNRSGGSLTRNGITVASNTVGILAGTGVQGTYSGVATTGWGGMFVSGVANDQVTDDLIVASAQPGYGMAKISSGATTVSAYGSTHAISKVRYRFIGGERRVYYYDTNDFYLRYIRLSDGAITNVAGNGVNASAGNGGAATSASLNIIYGQVAFDSNDNIYIPEYASGTIRIICATTAVGICSGANRVNASGHLLVDSSGTTTATAGNIYRLIGTGTSAVSTANDTAPLATSLYYPSSVEVTPAGHVLWSDYNRIRAFNTSGSTATIAGLSVLSNTVKTVVGLASGSTGYGADGVLASSSGTAFSCFSGYFNCTDIKMGPDGNIWYQEAFTPDSSRYLGRLRKVDLTTGIATTVLGAGSSHEGTPIDVNAPARTRPSRNTLGVAVASDGTLFFNDGNGVNYAGLKSVSPITGYVNNVGGRLQSPSSGLLFLTETGAYSPSLITLDSNDGLFYGDLSYHSLYYWNRTDATNLTIGGVLTTPGRLYHIGGVFNSSGYSGSGLTATTSRMDRPYKAVASGTDVIVSDYGNSCIRKINSAGVMSDIVGTCGAPGSGVNGAAPTATALSLPTGIAVDSLGNLAVCDYNNSRIRYFNLTGSTITAFNQTIPANSGIILAGAGADATGSGVASTTSSARCIDVGFDSSGNLFMTDYVYFMVRKINRTGASAGLIETVAGRYAVAGGAYRGSMRSWDGSQEGATATSTDLGPMYGLAFDPSGDLYVSQFTGIGGIKKIKLTP